MASFHKTRKSHELSIGLLGDPPDSTTLRLELLLLSHSRRQLNRSLEPSSNRSQPSLPLLGARLDPRSRPTPPARLPLRILIAVCCSPRSSRRFSRPVPFPVRNCSSSITVLVSPSSRYTLVQVGRERGSVSDENGWSRKSDSAQQHSTCSCRQDTVTDVVE